MTHTDQDRENIFNRYDTGDLIIYENKVRGEVVKKTDLYMIVKIDGEESMLTRTEINYN